MLDASGFTRTISLADFAPIGDGISDDTPALQRLFTHAAALDGATVVIPPGSYFLAGEQQIPLPSRVTVSAHGARFLLPERLGDGAHLVFFSGCDITDFAWSGGEFFGHCFDHRCYRTAWAPNVNTRIFLITTSPGGTTTRIRFSDLRASRIAGAVVTVLGVKASERDVQTYAEHVHVERCVFDECGKFMWDYGLLWQIVTWPEEYSPADVALAEQFFCNDLVHGPVAMRDGDDRVYLDNRRAGLHVSANMQNDETVCFFGDVLPLNVARGRKYAIVHATADYVQIADTTTGSPLVFAGNAGPNARCLSQLHQAYYFLFAPIGAGPGKGGLDLVACRYVNVSGCHLSALGDTMHIQCSRVIVFTGNQITGSRMGAFFLAEHCRNAVVVGNTVDGTNGSRVMSIEQSCTEVTVTGNTFRNGGRGSWINQPQGLILANNIFINNTTKGERNPWRGRKCLETGDYQRWPEIYFTTYEKDGRYGPVVVQGNLFVTGDECADTIAFANGGHDLLVTGNIFDGPVRSINVADGCEPPVCAQNIGLVEEGDKRQAGKAIPSER